MEKVIVIISLIILLLLGIKHIIDQYKYNPNISRVLGIFTVGYSVLGYLLMKRYDNLSLNTKLNLLSVIIVFLCLYFLFIGSGKKEDGENINETMVKEGYACLDKEYSKKDVQYKIYEQKARFGEKGLWSKKNPVPPWDFRKKDKKKNKS